MVSSIFSWREKRVRRRLRRQGRRRCSPPAVRSSGRSWPSSSRSLLHDRARVPRAERVPGRIHPVRLVAERPHRQRERPRSVDLDLARTRSPSSPARAAGSGWRAPRRSLDEGCRVTICARGERAADGRGGRRALRAACRRRDPGRVLAVRGGPVDADGVERSSSRDRRGLRRPRHPRQQRRPGARGSTIVDTRTPSGTEALDQTLFPAIRASRLAVPHMRRRGGGAIVMIASIWGRESGGRMTYNAVKAAEISLAKSMAQQLARDNIRVNSVAPGSILVSGRIVASASAGGSGGDRRLRRCANCRSDASAAPRKSGRSSRSSRRRARAGSAGPVSRSTAASPGR